MTYVDVTDDEIKTWLEWAGARLLSLNLASPLPKGPHVSWPAYAQDSRVAYGYTQERLRAAHVSSAEIKLMDELLILPSLIPDVLIRRIVNARILVTPVSNRYVYSWTRLAYMLHSDRRRVARLYDNGINEIARKLRRSQIDAFRKSFEVIS